MLCASASRSRGWQRSVAKLRFVGSRRYPPARNTYVSRFHSCSSSALPRSLPRGSLYSSLPLRSRSRRSTLLSADTPAAQPPETQLVAEQQLDEVDNVETQGGDAGADGSGRDDESRKQIKTKSAAQALRRGGGIRKLDGIPPFVVPAWFLKHNVKIADQRPYGFEKERGLKVFHKDSAVNGKSKWLAQKRLLSLNAISEAEHRSALAPEWDQMLENLKDSWDPTPKMLDETREEPHIRGEKYDFPSYEIAPGQWREVISSISACLTTAHSGATNSFSTAKCMLRLHCPVQGSLYFQDRVVELAAHILGADLIKIDAQDLACFAHDYIQEGPESFPMALWSLSYDMQTGSKRTSTPPVDTEVKDDGAEQADSHGMESRENAQSASESFHVLPVLQDSRLGEALSKAFENIGASSFPSMSARKQTKASNSIGNRYADNSYKEDMWNDLKLNHMLQHLLESNMLKRNEASLVPKTSTEQQENQTNEQEDSAAEEAQQQRKVIVMIRDQKNMSMNGQGPQIVQKLEDQIRERRRQGEQIMMIGTHASSDTVSEFYPDNVDTVQSEWPESLGRTILITPARATTSNRERFQEDESRRYREVNLRNISETMRRLDPSENWHDPDLQLNPTMTREEFRPLEANALAYTEVQKIASIALAEYSRDRDVSLKYRLIAKALRILQASNEEKKKWFESEKALPLKKARDLGRNADADQTATGGKRAAINRLAKECNRYEKQLLHGVVNPENIRTTFDQVHAPKETIESLRTITMLPLSRRDAFKYGVLATDKLSGLLLYGPPGTGKTLLAKAVAKESGASVLEISGGDLYNMYVGEGEKNVKAVFSLARKLSPCVVFIDEADAIFHSRGEKNRNTHREMINQFLKEWDGMKETDAFIMVATNRPFDLDEAVLRRLPRRLLVDLPVEKDRASILDIHLKDEMLDESVSIPQLASQTPFYSGSDLKNVSVAAALAAVREEFEEGQRHEVQQAEKPEAERTKHKYPEKRVLHHRHFEKALHEISASISEDMSTLSAIRKFDEKYGDRRGRRRKPGFGYGTDTGEERDTTKVRN